MPEEKQLPAGPEKQPVNVDAQGAMDLGKARATQGEKIRESLERSLSRHVFGNMLRQLERSFEEKGGMDFHVRAIAQHNGMQLLIPPTEARTDERLWTHLERAAETHAKDAKAPELELLLELYGRETIENFVRGTAAIAAEHGIDPLTRATFLYSIPDLERLSKVYYDTLVYDHDVDEARMAATRARYANIAAQMAERFPASEKGAAAEREKTSKDNGPSDFHVVEGKKGKCDYRLYVSAEPYGDPGAVLTAWQKAMEQSGLQGEVYWKFLLKIDNRFDMICAYPNREVDAEKMAALFAHFRSLCPDALLRATMPTCPTRIQQGIFIAPNVRRLSEVTKWFGDDALSYNQLLSALLLLSLRLAVHHRESTGTRPTEADDDLYRDAAVRFDELLRLSSIDPTTMLSSSTRSPLPLWAKTT